MERWIDFHRKRAEYQILCRSCNAKKGSKPSSHLRPYQQSAVEAAKDHMRRSVMPGLLELATGAGKSHIIAALAHWVHDQHGKRVLCLQPSKELTTQNYVKYTATGNSASIFSSSAGSKCMRHAVVYGTPGTVKNSLSRFGDQFGAVIIDEAHGITPTIREIVAHLQQKNPRLRVLGMTATPYRLGSGYIYQYDTDGRHVPEDRARDPYFSNLLYQIQTGELIEQGYLTPAHADPGHAAGYDASGLELNARGQFDARAVEQVFEGRGRLTAQIVADVVAHSTCRRGVMLFAATVDHAKEILESLPPDNARMLGGDINMRKAEREKLIGDFKAQRFRYIVSVGTLTTGFDAPHVDLIAILRATESPGLLQQIIGRGLRLCDGKQDCLVLDYAENIARHGLQDYLFAPDIKAKGITIGGVEVPAHCPECGYRNEFTARLNPDEFGIDEEGYFVDLSGARIEDPEHGPIPAHHGRRCCGQVKGQAPGRWERCAHRWNGKACPACEHENDIAARYCEACKEELVDPNEKLQIEFQRVKKDPYSRSTDRVLSWDLRKTVSQAGNEVLKVDFTTDYRSFSIWLTPAANQFSWRKWESFSKAIFRGHIAPDIDTLLQHIDKAKMPETITSKRQKNSKFFEVYAYNLPEDKSP